MRRVSLAALLLVALASVDPAAQQEVPPARASQSLTSSATAILVDVIVRDRSGRLVMDLSAADFELFEDGVAQKVGSFTRISRGGGIGVGIAWRSPATSITTARPDAPSASPGADSAPESATTALVFDRLSAESLRLAQRATLAYIPMNGDSPDRMAVFASDPGVKVLQPFTTDRVRVRQAIERVLPSGTAAAEQHAERATELTARKREIEGQSDSTSAQAGAGNSTLVAQNASAMGVREAERRLVQTELNMMRSFDNLDRDMRGYESSVALLSVIDSLRLYPGRKTIVLFSEGLPASPVLSARLDRVIEAANRANVTAYVVDAHGLRAASTLAATRKEMEDFADERLRQLASSRDETNQPLTLAFERVEDTMRLDSRAGLARLAEDTGGILVDGTNDLSAALRRIDEDNQFHYLLSYSPKNDALDGTFRRIDVKVRRPRTQVFARKGYRATGASGTSHAGAVEAAALSLLERGPIPNAFAMHAAGFSFPDPGRPGLTVLLVNVRSGVADFAVDPRRGTYSAQLAIVVRITDDAGRELQKFSQQYALSGEAKDIEAAKNGNILFYREATMPPGVYTAESVVYDAGAGRGSARVATLTVPPVEAKALGVSSLVLVDRVEQLKDAPAADSAPPFYVGRTLLYPNLGEAFQKSATREVPFYFAAYGDTSRAQWSVQLVRNGAVLAEAPIALPPATGARVLHVGRVPVEGLPSGTYELRIGARIGAEEVSRSAYFTLRD